MALPRRLLAPLLLAAATITCTDLTGPGPSHRTGSIALNPVFARSAQAAPIDLSVFGLSYDHVHVEIRDLTDTTLIVIDTSVAFSPTSEQLTLELSVPVERRNQSFSGVVEFTSEGAVMFRGSQVVEAFDASERPAETPPFPVHYVGPGANVASVTISPDSLSFTTADYNGQQLTITALDSSGTQVYPPMSIVSLDTSIATLNLEEGINVFQHGKRGTALITATVPNGVSASTKVVVAEAPDSVFLDGDFVTTAAAGTQLPQPLVFKVIDAQGQPFPNQLVRFDSPTAGVSFDPTESTTDADGRVSVSVTLGEQVGEQWLYVYVPYGNSSGLFTSVLLTATTPPEVLPESLYVVSGGDQTGVAGSVLAQPVVLKAIGTGGAPMANTIVQISDRSPGLRGDGGSYSADANGTVSMLITLGTAAGPQFLTATTWIKDEAGNILKTLNTTVNFTAVAGPASGALSTIVSDVQSITADTIPTSGLTDTVSTARITVRTFDQYGNALSAGGAQVTLKTNLGAFGSMTTDTAKSVVATDKGNGTYEAIFRSTKSGTATITATIGSDSVAGAASVNVTPGLPYKITLADADGFPIGQQTVGSAFTVRLTLRDRWGNEWRHYSGQEDFVGVPTLSLLNGTFADGSTSMQAPAFNGSLAVATVIFGSPSPSPQQTELRAQVLINAEENVSGSALITVVASPAGAIARFAPMMGVLTTFAQVSNESFAPEGYPYFRAEDAAGDAIAAEQVKLVTTGPCVLGDGTSITRETNADGIIQLQAGDIFIPTQDSPFSCVVTATSVNTPSVKIVYRYVGYPSGAAAWLGIKDKEWSNADNWLDGVPNGQRPVFIPAAAEYQPTLSADDQSVYQNLTVEDGALLDLGTHTLAMSGTVGVSTGASGAIANGLLNVGGEVSLNGIFPNVTCGSGILGPTNSESHIIVAGTLTLQCRLDPNGTAVSVAGDMVTSGGVENALLSMLKENSLLSISGNLKIASFEAAQALQTGNIVVGGDFDASAGRFWSDGTALHLIGSKPTVTPSTSTENQFAKIYVEGKSAAVTLANSIYSDTIFLVVPASLTIQQMLNASAVVLAAGSSVAVAPDATVTLGRPFELTSGSSITFSGAATLQVNADATKEGLLVLGANSVVTLNGTDKDVFNIFDATGERPSTGCQADPSAKIQGTNTTAVAYLKTLCGIKE